MTVSRLDRELVQENRQLREALETLLSEMDAANYAIDTDAVRASMPDRKTIDPPWEREGYSSKDEWLADKRGN